MVATFSGFLWRLSSICPPLQQAVLIESLPMSAIHSICSPVKGHVCQCAHSIITGQISPSTLPYFSFMLWSKRLLVSLKFGLYCLGQYFNNCSPSLCCYVWQFTGNWTHLLLCPGSVDIHHCSWIRHLNHWEVVDVSCSCCCGYGTDDWWLSDPRLSCAAMVAAASQWGWSGCCAWFGVLLRPTVLRCLGMRWQAVGSGDSDVRLRQGGDPVLSVNESWGHWLVSHPLLLAPLLTTCVFLFPFFFCFFCFDSHIINAIWFILVLPLSYFPNLFCSVCIWFILKLPFSEKSNFTHNRSS